MADHQTPDPPAADPTAPPQVAPPRLGQCLVCGEAIQRGNLVGCSACDTPHHRDCFEYNGNCAVYACGSKVYTLKWKAMGREQSRRITAGPAQPGVAAGPAESPRVFTDPRPPTRLRTQEALGEHEIRIESSGMVRSLGIAVMSFGGVFGAAFSGSIAPQTAGCGCDGLGEALASGGEGFLAVVLIFGVLALLWFVLAAVIPGLLQLIGNLLYWTDSSYWTVEDERLVLHGRIFGIPFWRRGWAASRAESVVVGPLRPNGYNWLVVRFNGGRQVYLADDRQHARCGYDASDLSRMGRRLAEALGVRYQPVAAQEDLPAQPHE